MDLVAAGFGATDQTIKLPFRSCVHGVGTFCFDAAQFVAWSAACFCRLLRLCLFCCFRVLHRFTCFLRFGTFTTSGAALRESRSARFIPAAHGCLATYRQLTYTGTISSDADASGYTYTAQLIDGAVQLTVTSRAQPYPAVTCTHRTRVLGIHPTHPVARD